MWAAPASKGHCRDAGGSWGAGDTLAPPAPRTSLHGRAQTQCLSLGCCWPSGLVVGILGRARLARDRGFAQHPCCRRLLPSPAARPAKAGPRGTSGCDAGAAVQAHGHRHPLFIPPSVRLSIRAGPRVPSESVFPLFKQSLFHTRCQSLPACSRMRQYI